MSIKRIYLDIDNTIMYNNDISTISDELIAEISRLKNKNIVVRIATGRIYDATKAILEKLNISDITVLYNGALAVDKDKNIVYREILNKETLDILVDLSHKYDIPVNMYNEDTIFFEKETEMGNDYIKLGIEKYEIIDLKTLNYTNKALYMGEHEVLVELEKEIKEKIKGVTTVFSRDYYLEVLSKDVSKGSAIKAISDMEGISLDEVMAFGDQWNDYDMLKTVGHGYLMGNASDELKEKFDNDKIIGKCKENGVANFLKSI